MHEEGAAEASLLSLPRFSPPLHAVVGFGRTTFAALTDEGAEHGPGSWSDTAAATVG